MVIPRLSSTSKANLLCRPCRLIFSRFSPNIFCCRPAPFLYSQHSAPSGRPVSFPYFPPSAFCCALAFFLYSSHKIFCGSPTIFLYSSHSGSLGGEHFFSIFRTGSFCRDPALFLYSSHSAPSSRLSIFLDSSPYAFWRAPAAFLCSSHNILRRSPDAALCGISHRTLFGGHGREMASRIRRRVSLVALLVGGGFQNLLALFGDSDFATPLGDELVARQGGHGSHNLRFMGSAASEKPA